MQKILLHVYCNNYATELVISLSVDLYSVFQVEVKRQYRAFEFKCFNSLLRLYLFAVNSIKVVLPKAYTVNHERARDDRLLLNFTSL